MCSSYVCEVVIHSRSEKNPTSLLYDFVMNVHVTKHIMKSYTVKNSLLKKIAELAISWRRGLTDAQRYSFREIASGHYWYMSHRLSVIWQQNTVLLLDVVGFQGKYIFLRIPGIALS